MNKDEAKIMLPDGRIAYDCLKLAAIPTEGIYLKAYPNHYIEITTRNTKYRFVTGACPTGEAAVGLAVKEDGSRPRFLAEPAEVTIHGSTWGGSMLKLGYVGIGMHLEFSYGKYPRITTSEIQGIRVVEAEKLAA